MQGYQYKHGDRPLEGYTIQRAVGRGGFGEVYYALSDSGREVALKAVQGYEEIELRGIRQCMNLKSPYLVTIFDVKYNDKGKPFVIMEYVSGPSLRDLLVESPSGLGAQKSAFMLREIAKGLTYLHDRGIVHRDLKPGNIFYEDGYVKIGDYGLSKAMTASQHSGQTVTVGTVHYMAPEIGQGKYDQSIDIYALGIVLYEMLSGQVPFFGASPGEILMKHMASEPDLDQIDEPFATVIRRAMAKDPTNRYQTVQEMVEDVFGAEHVRQSVSHFRVEELSAVAERIGQKVAAGVPVGEPGRGEGSSAHPTVTLEPVGSVGDGSSNAWDEQADGWVHFAHRMDRLGERMGHLGTHLGRIGSRIGTTVGERVGREVGARHWGRPAISGDPSRDLLAWHQRWVLAFITALVVVIATALIYPDILDWYSAIVVIAIVGTSGGIYAARYYLKLPSESRTLARLAYGGLGCLVGLVCAGPMLVGLGGPGAHDIQGTVLAVLVSLLVLNWPDRTAPARASRVSLGWAISAGLVGLITAVCLEGIPEIAVGILCGVSLVVQVICPFDPVAAKHLKAARRDRWHHRHAHADRPKEAGAEDPLPHAAPAPGSPAVAGRRPAPPHGAAHPQRAPWAMQPPGRPVPGFVRILSLLTSGALMALSVVMLVWAGTVRHDDETAIGLSAGVGFGLLSVFLLVKACQPTFLNWWASVVKPLLLLCCVEWMVTVAVCMGLFRMNNDAFLVALFLLLFAIPVFFAIAAIPSQARPPAPPKTGFSERRRLFALLLSAGWLAGIAGLQRFYVGKVGTGLIWLLTGGLLGVGQLFDIIMIAMGRFRDREGLPLIVWQTEDELKHHPMPTVPPAAVDPGPRVAPAAPPEPAQAPPPPPAHTAPAQPFEPPQPSRTSAPRRTFGPFAVTSVLLSLIGGLLLLVTLAVGLAVAVGLPRMIAADVLDEGMASGFDDAFGYREWPRLLERIGMAITVTTAFLAAVCLIIARVRTSGAHIFRAIVGCFGILLALAALQGAMEGIRWDQVAALFKGDQIGPAIEMLLGSVEAVPAAVAGGVFLVSMALLAYPARRHPVEPASQGGQEA